MEKPKSRKFIQTNTEYINVPVESLERFLTSPTDSLKHMSQKHFAMAGLSSCTEGYQVDRYKFVQHLLLFTLEGEGSLRIENGNRIRLGAGDLFIAPRRSTYTYSTDSHWKTAWLHIRDSRLWNDAIGEEPVVRKSIWSEEIVGVMQGFINESNRRCPDSSVAIRSYVDLLFLYVQRELTQNNTQSLETRHSLEGLWDKVQEDLRNGWTVENLAGLVHMSRSSFHRTVFQLTGSSPMQIVNTMRMERAMELLLYTGQNLTAIAYEVGYENQFSFSKAFKKHARISPKEFREQKNNS